jgi:hypothetical protein
LNDCEMCWSTPATVLLWNSFCQNFLSGDVPRSTLNWLKGGALRGVLTPSKKQIQLLLLL